MNEYNVNVIQMHLIMLHGKINPSSVIYNLYNPNHTDESDSLLSPFLTGAEIRSVCTEAGMFAIRSRRKMATEKDFLEAVNKVIKAYAKFSSTPRYMTYN